VTSTTTKAQRKVQRFVNSITKEERMLVVLNRELYEGNWDEMMADLKARLEGGPYIFKLVHRIQDDIERIDRLRDFERKMGTNLGDYIEPGV